MPGIRLIVGLGNIGAQYESTRHNAGFWFVDALARRSAGLWNREARFHGEATRVAIGGQSCWLLKPHTLMNRSGQAVAALAGFYKIPLAEILVAHDELDMAPGQARLKFDGGVAGHNGLKDIRARCGGAAFWRLRLGIGHPRDVDSRQPVADYVLRPPSLDDLRLIDAGIDHALEAVEAMVLDDAPGAMQRLHGAVGRPPSAP
ncbi:MAG: aminoacyl-tRNA hydrolase [Burkholderiaceae bacterium]